MQNRGVHKLVMGNEISPRDLVCAIFCNPKTPFAKIVRTSINVSDLDVYAEYLEQFAANNIDVFPAKLVDPKANYYTWFVVHGNETVNVSLHEIRRQVKEMKRGGVVAVSSSPPRPPPSAPSQSSPPPRRPIRVAAANDALAPLLRARRTITPTPQASPSARIPRGRPIKMKHAGGRPKASSVAAVAATPSTKELRIVLVDLVTPPSRQVSHDDVEHEADAAPDDSPPPPSTVGSTPRPKTQRRKRPADAVPPIKESRVLVTRYPVDLETPRSSRQMFDVGHVAAAPITSPPTESVHQPSDETTRRQLRVVSTEQVHLTVRRLPGGAYSVKDQRRRPPSSNRQPVVRLERLLKRLSTTSRYADDPELQPVVKLVRLTENQITSTLPQPTAIRRRRSKRRKTVASKLVKSFFLH